MVIDEELLRRARASAGRLADAQRQAEVAKADYQHAVRRLHIAGASMREIAEALEVSHQRVHQVVEASGGSRSWRVDARSSDGLACSFCGRGRDEVGKLVAGPGVYICDGCGVVARRAFGSARPVVVDGLLFDLVTSGKSACSFCGRRVRKNTALVTTADGEARVCGKCMDFLQEVLDDADTSVR